MTEFEHAIYALVFTVVMSKSQRQPFKLFKDEYVPQLPTSVRDTCILCGQPVLQSELAIAHRILRGVDMDSARVRHVFIVRNRSPTILVTWICVRWCKG